jgi:hypothetical protein
LLGAEAIGAYIAGCYLGRMVCYGRLGRFLKSSQLSLRVDPAHPDMAGGLKPIGDFFFFQAAIAGLPALFLAIWLVLISFAIFPGVERYEIWAGPYAGLLMLAIAIEVTAFILPLWFFHGQMKTQKKLLLKKADELSAEIAELRTALGRDADSATREQHKNALSDMVERWRALEDCPVWPMDVKMKRRFAVNNVVLLLPAIGQYTGLSRGLSKLLAKIVEANFS